MIPNDSRAGNKFEKPSMNPSVVLGLMLVFNSLGAFSMSSMPPLFSEMSANIDMSRAQMGSLMGVAVLSALIFAPLGGMLADRIGARWTVGIGISVAGIAGSLRVVADTPYELMACMFGMGAGYNLVGPTLPKVLGQTFAPERLASVNGIVMASFGLGAAIGTALSASVLSPALGGWRPALLVPSLAFLSTGLLWVLIYRDPQQTEPAPLKTPSPFADMKQVLGVRNIRLLAAFLFVQGLGFSPVLTFLPISLQERGIAGAGQLSAIVMGVGMVFNLIGGRLSDRIGRRKPLLLYGTVITGLCIMTFSELSGAALVVALALAGAGSGCLGPILFTLPVETPGIGSKLAATAAGLIIMFQSVTGFLAPILLGMMIDRTGSYATGFVFSGIAVLAASLFILPMLETGVGAHNRKDQALPG